MKVTAIPTASSSPSTSSSPWTCHSMDMLSALMVPWNSLVTVGFPSKGSVTLSFDDLFAVILNKLVDQIAQLWWFETPWCQCELNVVHQFRLLFGVHNESKYFLNRRSLNSLKNLETSHSKLEICNTNLTCSNSSAKIRNFSSHSSLVTSYYILNHPRWIGSTLV